MTARTRRFARARYPARARATRRNWPRQTFTSTALSPDTRSTSTWSSSTVSDRAPSRANTGLPLTHTRIPSALPNRKLRLPGLGTRNGLERICHRARVRDPSGSSRPTVSSQLLTVRHFTRGAVGTFLLLAVLGTNCRLAAGGTQAVRFERARKWAGDQPLAQVVPVAALPGLAHFILELGRGRGRGACAFAKPHTKRAESDNANRMDRFMNSPREQRGVDGRHYTSG